MFSFVDISHGRIYIDGKGASSWLHALLHARGNLGAHAHIADTSTIPLGLLRSRLGIIAQDPVLLSGSLRLNLDIESKYTDEQLYDALHQVQLVKRKNKSPSKSSSSTTLSDATINVNEVTPEPSSPISAAATAVEAADTNVNIFNNLDFEIKSGGEK